MAEAEALVGAGSTAKLLAIQQYYSRLQPLGPRSTRAT
jgi:hypothetical protein